MSTLKSKKLFTPLPFGVLVGIVPSVIGGGAIAVLLVVAAATAARRVLAAPIGLLVRGRLRLVGPSRWPHILGVDFLARDASVVVVVVVHNLKILKMPLTNVSRVPMFPHRLQRWRYGTQPHNWPRSVLQILLVHAEQ